jgi:hypothetical protein
MALDLSTPMTPPPRRPGTRVAPASNKASEKAREARQSERQEGLEGLGQLAQIPLMVTGNLSDMGAVTTHWPNVARETAALAETNEKIGQAVDKVIAVGPFAGVITAVIPLVLQILVNHGRLPAGMFAQFGVEPPEMMQRRASIHIQRQAAEIARQEAEAHAELIAAQADLERIQQESRNAANGSKPEAE